MMFTIYLLCLSASFVLVKANPLDQAIQTPTCPICQQNGRNIPTNVPVTLQQPTSYFNPYSQVNLVQNPVTQSCQTPQIVPVSNNQIFVPNNQLYQCSSNNNQCLPNNFHYNQQLPTNNKCLQGNNQQSSGNRQLSQADNQLNQEFVSNILSNPTLRTILDPNTKLYNHNGNEVQRQIPLTHNSGSVPNVINNYIIVPPELLLNNTVNKESKKLKRNSQQNRRIKNKNKNQSETKTRRKQNQEYKENRKDTIENSLNKRSKSQKEIKTDLQESNKNNVTKDSDKIVIKEDKPRRKSKTGKEEKTLTNTSEVSKDKVIETSKVMQEINSKDTKPRDNDNTMQIENTQQVINNLVLANNENNDLKNYRNYEHVMKKYQNKLNERVNTKNSTQQNSTQANSLRLNSKEKEQRTAPGTICNKPKRKNDGHTDIRLKINAVQRNPREEAIIQDFRKKFPAIPEDVLRSLLSYLKQQLQNEQLGAPNFYYPHFPISYDQLYQTQNRGSNTDRKDSRRKNRRNQKRKRQRNKNNEYSKACNTTIELTPTLIEKPIEDVVSPTEIVQNFELLTTENESQVEPNSAVTDTTEVAKKTALDDTTTISTPPNVDILINSENSSKFIEESQEIATKIEDVIETTTSITLDKQVSEEIKPGAAITLNSEEIVSSNHDNTQTPELSTEDVVPTIFMNSIVDYFPDFRADNQAYVITDEEYILKNLEVDRYHYTTDKNVEVSELNKEIGNHEQNLDHDQFRHPKNEEKRQHQQEKSKDEKDTSDTIHYDDVEDTIPRPYRAKPHVEKIQFRTPPTLEIPDFETKKVDRVSTYYEDDYDDETIDKYINNGDKLSTYSNVKTSRYATENKPANDIRRRKGNSRKKSKDNVETSYARSKVVKYGQTPEYSEDLNTTPMTKDFNNDRDIKSDRYRYTSNGGPSIVFAQSIPGDFW